MECLRAQPDSKRELTPQPPKELNELAHSRIPRYAETFGKQVFWCPFQLSKLKFAKKAEWKYKDGEIDLNQPPKLEAIKPWFGCFCIPLWVLVWFVPFFIAGSGFFLQNFQLRIATYYYVHEMVDYELKDLQSGPPPEGIPFSAGTYPKNASFGSLNDPVEGIMGKYEAVNIHFLDVLAALFPCMFMVAALLTDQSLVWTRILMCMAVLAVMKGFFGWITIEPDSNGWQVCKERLESNKAWDVSWYAKERTYLELLTMSPTSRMCADMMYSGHTYFVTIFALGLFEVTRLSFRAYHWQKRMAIEFAVALVAVIQQTLEIYFVLKSHFHYTADVCMALIITYLVYTNNTIAVWAKHWTRMRNREVCPIGQSKWFLNRLTTGAYNNLGCFCCAFGSHYTFGHADIVGLLKDIEEAQCTCLKEHNLNLVPFTMNEYVRLRMHMLDDDSIEPTVCRCCKSSVDQAKDDETADRISAYTQVASE